MVHLSKAAANEIRRLKSQQTSENSRVLRIGMQSGGCSDWSYTLEFTSEPSPSDQLTTAEDLTIAIAADAAPYLSDLSLDYSEDLMGGGFRFHNPAAASTCGCGHSFSIGNSLDLSPV
jgi:iron-sulfur cluster assembly protein